MTKYLCRIISRFTLIINDKVLICMYLWITVMHKKVSHPNEIQNTFVTLRVPLLAAVIIKIAIIRLLCIIIALIAWYEDIYLRKC